MQPIFVAFYLFETFLQVHSHGVIINPKSRQPGPAMKAACGQQLSNQQESDEYGNIQGELQVAENQNDYNADRCNLWLCKGFQFEDNENNVQSYSPGQQIDLTVDIRAPHSGTANISIVDVGKNEVIGSPLKTFSDYASNSHPIPDENKEFSISMPRVLNGRCTEPGECVIQWYWNAPDAKQTYESCIDFAMKNSSWSSKRGELQSTPAPVAATSSTVTNGAVGILIPNQIHFVSGLTSTSRS